MSQFALSGRSTQRVIVVAGVAVITLLVAAIELVAGSGVTYDVWGAMLIGPILVLVTIPSLVREARREADPKLLQFLTVALILKLLAALIRYYFDFHVYQGHTDALGYHQAGTRWAGHILAWDLYDGGQSLIGTNFIELVTGIVYAITRPTLLGGYLVFSWLAFLGLFFFYRAFVLAVPEGRSRTYARFLFFLPSLLFWSSGPGKDAWMVFTLGVACLGAAHLVTGRTWKGVATMSASLWLASLARPHVAGMLAISVAVSIGISSLWQRRSAMLPRRAAALGVAAVFTVVFVWAAVNYLASRSVDTDQGLAVALGEVENTTAQGGSEFQPFVVDSPAQFPRAAVTILFRPFPFEVNSAEALISGLEATFLLSICVLRFRWLLAAVSSLRRQPYVLMALCFVGLFIVGFSGIANFGILVRERTQMLPLFLVLLAIPPRIADQPQHEHRLSTRAQVR